MTLIIRLGNEVALTTLKLLCLSGNSTFFFLSVFIKKKKKNNQTNRKTQVLGTRFAEVLNTHT